MRPIPEVSTAAITLALLAVGAFGFLFPLSFLLVSFHDFQPTIAPGISDLNVIGGYLGTLWRTAIVAGLASALAFIAVEIALRRGFRIWKAGILLLLYGCDPVIRAKGIASAEVQLWSALGTSSWASFDQVLSNYVLPALLLAITYAPLYALSRLWDLTLRDRERFYRPSFLFLVLQPALGRAPPVLSLIFLLALFDPWTAALASRGQVDFWGNVVLRVAVQGRDINAALALALAGFAIVVAATSVLYAARAAWNTFFRQLKPSPRATLGHRHAVAVSELLALSLLAVAPWWWFVQSWVQAQPATTGVSFPEVGLQSLILLLAIVASSTIVASLLFFYSLRGSRHRLLAYAVSWILILLPEIIFVTASTLWTSHSSGRSGMIWGTVLFTSFSGLLVFLLLEQFVQTRRPELLPILRRQATFSVKTPILIVLVEFRPALTLAALLVSWMTLENVILLRAALGAETTTFAVTLYGGATRGIDANEAALVITELVSRLFLFAVGLIAAFGIRREQ